MARKKVKAKLKDKTLTEKLLDDYNAGMKLRDMAKKYEKSHVTILKYLRKNPDFKERGMGNHVSGKERMKYHPNPSRKNPVTRVVYCLSPELVTALENYPGKNKTEKITKAINEYLALKVRDRPKAKHKSNFAKDFSSWFWLDDKILAKLDRYDKKTSRTNKVLAAVEMMLKQE